jgi:hypothetical protein
MFDDTQAPSAQIVRAPVDNIYFEEGDRVRKRRDQINQTPCPSRQHFSAAPQNPDEPSCTARTTARRRSSATSAENRHGLIVEADAMQAA